MNVKRIRMVVVMMATGAVAACDGTNTFLGESDGGDGIPVDTFWSVPLDAGTDTGADAVADAVVWRDSAEPWAPPHVPYCPAGERPS